MIVPVHSTTLDGFPLADSQIISDLALVTTSGGTYLASMSYAADTWTLFDLSATGTPTFDQTQSLSQTAVPLGGGADMVSGDLDGQQFAVVIGLPGADTAFYSVNTDGTLSEDFTLAGDLTDLARLDAFLITESAGIGYAIAADHTSGALNVYVKHDASLTQVAAAPNVPGIDIADFAHLTAISTASADFLLAASVSDNQVVAFRIDAGGALSATGSLGQAQGVGIQSPSALASATIDGRDFVLVAGSGSNSISVFELDATGALTPTDHIIDDLARRFDQITSLTVSVAGDRVFVTAAGADDGFSLFSLLPGGRLFHEASVADSAAVTLDNITDIVSHIAGDTLSIYAASQSEPGITHYTADLSTLGSVLTGTATDDALTGTADDDVIHGFDGDDTLAGGAGDDILLDGAGSDTLTGGTGADSFLLALDGARDTITDFDLGQDQLDLSEYFLFQSAAQLALQSTPWGATISYAGDITDIYTSSGVPLTDTDFFGMQLLNLSRISVASLLAPQSLTGTAGDDVLFGGLGDDALSGLAGDDVLAGGAGGDLIDGGLGFDTASYHLSLFGLTADLALSHLNTGAATGDSYVGIEGLWGSGFADILRGTYLGDAIIGDGGDDLIFGRAGDDTLTGGAGDDVLRGGLGADALDGGTGFDRADYLQASVGLTADLALSHLNTGEATGDGYVGIEGLWGSGFADILRGTYLGDAITGDAGDDLIFGRAGDDTLTGGAGDDTLRGGLGADVLDGGPGFDLADYLQASVGVTADLIYAHTNTGEAAGDTYSGIDGLIGSNFGDVLRAGWGAEVLEGRAGDDTLMGRAGNDVLAGGLGDDVLTGGPGADEFHFERGHDQITDFAACTDTLGFDPGLWGGAPWGLAEILATASPGAQGLTFTFDAANTLRLSDIASTSEIENDIFIL